MVYRIEEADLLLPEGWSDHTMNVFRLPGVKDASLIVTRDSETPIEDPQEYAEKQQIAAQEQFDAYKALRTGPTEIDGKPAFLVEYQWRGSGSALLRQRQVFVRHRDLMMVVTLTAIMDNFAQHDPAWDDFIASIKLREALPPTAAIDTPIAANDDGPASSIKARPADAYVFALRPSERVLHVLDSTQDPNAICNAVDVEDGLWEFFDTAGMPLRWRMLRPNRRGVFRSEPGLFGLIPQAGGGVQLLQRMSEVPYLKAHGALDDLAKVREHLGRFSSSETP